MGRTDSHADAESWLRDTAGRQTTGGPLGPPDSALTAAIRSAHWDGHITRNRQQEGPLSGVAANSVHDAQELLAVYPMASANPTNHVARHLSSMTLTAQPPSFVQPNYYVVQGTGYPPGNPPPYTEYAQEISYLGSSQASSNDSGYWSQTRDDAVRLLGDQSGSSYTYQEPAHWAPASAHQSNFQTNSFAQSLFQHTSPAHAYPTPPPPGITHSSSSLAFALGRPPPQPAKTYPPEESQKFFDNFVEQKSREMANARRPVTPPPKPAPPAVEESPDPLALQSGDPIVTPRKRKVYVQLDSPAVKRLHSVQSFRSESTTPRTPSHAVPKAMNTPNKAATLPRRGSVSQVSQKRLGKMKFDDTPDLGGYGSEDDDGIYSPTRTNDTVKSSARRTGERDDRAPLEKFTSLVEDVFEAEDGLPPDVDLSELPSDFFSSLTTTDATRPLLSAAITRKLTKYIGHVARPVKRVRTGVQNTPRGKGRMAEVDTQVLSRLLKMLERNVRAGEDVDPFRYIAAARTVSTSPSKKSPKKAARGRRRSKSRTPGGSNGEDDEDGDEQERTAPAETLSEVTEADFEKLARVLDVARDSILAADCCIALLASDRLTKQLYSEELITACLSTVKNQLTKIIYPFVEASTDLGPNTNANSSIATSISPLLRHLVLDSSPTAQAHRRQLCETFQALSSVLPRVNSLVNAESVAMSDTIIIQAVYIAIGPFFVVESGGGDGESSGGRKKAGDAGSVVLKTFGKSAMRGLRLDALALIRSIFANHDDQRSWIIEEILSSLIKLSDTKQKAGQFRLRDGRSIRTVSALLLQLVQTSAHDVRIEARKIDKTRQNRFALKRQESMTESQANQLPPEPFLDEIDLEEINLYGSGLDSATKAAKTIILFLTQRSGKGKATKNSNEAEYRTIFDNLISDLLAVLYWPEWPAASLLLSIACKFMVSSLDDVKTSHTDNNAAKTIALDHLGVIAARIRSSTLKVQSDRGESGRSLKPLDEIVSTVNVKELDKLLAAHKDIAAHLCKRASEDQACDSARELTAATLGLELASALKQVNSWIADPDGDDDLNLKDQSKLEPFGQRVKNALRNVWKEPATDVFDIGSQEEVVRIDRLADEVGTIQSLRNSFQPILTVILMALDAPAIFMRTKALRALGQIVTSDATILSTPNVRRSIESHLLDSSPAVRDAAVELIGKYMVDSPKVAGDYYQKIADRIADTGLSVRKRVIKLLKSFYSVTEDTARRIDITTRVVLRMLDEDETVRDLAIKTVEELWFPATALPPATKPRTSASSDKALLLTKVAVIMGTAANFKDRQSPLEDLLHKLMVDKSGTDATTLHSRYTEICETLIDGLVDASDLPGFTVINCIRTIHLFTSAYPAILSGSNASTLLPYLRNATTPEGQATSDYLLKIFRVSIPHMPKTAAKFAQELQTALQPMIIKPSGGGVQVLQEAVALNLLKSCNARLQDHMRRPLSKEMAASEVRALSILIFIVALLGEHCDFDTVRKDHPELAPDIDRISQASIVEHIYDSLLQLYEKYDIPSLRGRILQCLGFLFRAQPTLMTMGRSSSIMDAIFASPEEEGRGRLLKIMQDFLVSEAAKHSAQEKEVVKSKAKPAEVNMEELVGNTDGFADSGVSSAIVQRYLQPILDAALSQNPHIQTTAIDVLTFTIKQGLAHPLQSFPVIIALETSPIPSRASRASALHTILHGKHASLLNTRFIVSARASYDYQKKVISGPVRGFRAQPAPTALLQRWYSLVREKRPTRQDFLKALVKVFQDSKPNQATQDDVDFTRYMAENFSAFDYKTQEEVITVIKHLTAVLSTTGMQLLETISPSHLLTHLRAPSQQAPASAPEATDAMQGIIETNSANPLPDLQDSISLMRSSVIIAMVMLLKAHLKMLYSLSEEKCNKFSLGKKSAIGDKPAVKRHEKPISWDRLPFAMTPIVTTDDVEIQKARFLDIWNEDGLTAEPEDDEFL
ncbi:putative sister chromatid cohesion protein [Lyophyllum shimeji]|uniref:Sister chromatid cohesion protein n=1 Tax=Lyophyllum shimeji TaxID=47721 RepID=A0A9P3UUD2_LYOSH|nr:putative sister chromatid cohesion protein [Lyophyllum shimeji]